MPEGEPAWQKDGARGRLSFALRAVAVCLLSAVGAAFDFLARLAPIVATPHVGRSGGMISLAARRKRLDRGGQSARSQAKVGNRPALFQSDSPAARAKPATLAGGFGGRYTAKAQVCEFFFVEGLAFCFRLCRIRRFPLDGALAERPGPRRKKKRAFRKIFRFFFAGA